MQYMYVIFLCVGIKNNLVGGTDRPADSHSKYFFFIFEKNVVVVHTKGRWNQGGRTPTRIEDG